MTDTDLYNLGRCSNKNQKLIEIIKEDFKKGNNTMLFFKDRHEIAKLFEKWCDENNADKRCNTNFVSFLQIHGLLNIEKCKEFLFQNKEEKKNEDNKG